MPRYCHASPRRRAPQQAGRWAPPPDAGSAHGGGLADRLVLACTECPPTRPSKRRPPRWATVARQVAAAVGAEPAAVSAALAAALAGTEPPRCLPNGSAREGGQRARHGAGSRSGFRWQACPSVSERGRRLTSHRTHSPPGLGSVSAPHSQQDNFAAVSATGLTAAFAAVLAVASSASVSALTTGEPSNSRRNIGSSFMPSTVRNSRAIARFPPLNRPLFPLVPPFSPLLTVTPFKAPVGPLFRCPPTVEQCAYKGEQGGTGGNTLETQGGTGTTERRERSSAGMTPPPNKLAGNPDARLLVPCQAQRIG